MKWDAFLKQKGNDALQTNVLITIFFVQLKQRKSRLNTQLFVSSIVAGITRGMECDLVTLVLHQYNSINTDRCSFFIDAISQGS